MELSFLNGRRALSATSTCGHCSPSELTVGTPARCDLRNVGSATRELTTASRLMTWQMRGALVAGDVLTTATAGAEGLPGSRKRRTLPSRGHARRNGPGDGDRAAADGAPAHARGASAPRPAPATPAQRARRLATAAASRRSPPARSRRPPPPGEARSTAGVRCEPCTRTADEDHPRAPPEGGRADGRARLRRRRALAPGPEAQVAATRTSPIRWRWRRSSPSWA